MSELFLLDRILNPLRKMVTYIGVAETPTLYDTSNGFIIGPSGSRALYPGEQQVIDDYNNIVGQARIGERLALENLKKENLPFTYGMSGDAPDRFTDAENTTSPLTLDLNGDGVKTLSQSAGNHFDHAGDGFAERTGWVDKDDGLLVRDLDAGSLSVRGGLMQVVDQQSRSNLIYSNLTGDVHKLVFIEAGATECNFPSFAPNRKRGAHWGMKSS